MDSACGAVNSAISACSRSADSELSLVSSSRVRKDHGAYTFSAYAQVSDEGSAAFTLDSSIITVSLLFHQSSSPRAPTAGPARASSRANDQLQARRTAPVLAAHHRTGGPHLLRGRLLRQPQLGLASMVADGGRWGQMGGFSIKMVPGNQ